MSSHPGGSPDEAFPRDRPVALVRRLPACGRLSWRLARDRSVAVGARAAVRQLGSSPR